MSAKKTVVIIGPNGMLGQMAVDYFSKREYETIPIQMRFEENTKWDFIDSINKQEKCIVINCIGRIKQKTDDERDLLWSNTVLPLALSAHLKPSIHLIHPSTDCVYDGQTNVPYDTDFAPNARDSYGWSKILAEKAVLGRPNSYIMRVSIIGPDKNPKGKGLLAWFLSNPSKSRLKGYVNHHWNGITTLEWCIQAEKIIQNLNPIQEPCRLLQLGTTENHTKLGMLELFQKHFHTDFQIDSFTSSECIDRRLKPSVECKTLSEQLIELKPFISIRQ